MLGPSVYGILRSATAPTGRMHGQPAIWAGWSESEPGGTWTWVPNLRFRRFLIWKYARNPPGNLMTQQGRLLQIPRLLSHKDFLAPPPLPRSPGTSVKCFSISPATVGSILRWIRQTCGILAQKNLLQMITKRVSCIRDQVPCIEPGFRVRNRFGTLFLNVFQQVRTTLHLGGCQPFLQARLHVACKICRVKFKDTRLYPSVVFPTCNVSSLTGPCCLRACLH